MNEHFKTLVETIADDQKVDERTAAGMLRLRDILKALQREESDAWRALKALAIRQYDARIVESATAATDQERYSLVGSALSILGLPDTLDNFIATITKLEADYDAVAPPLDF